MNNLWCFFSTIDFLLKKIELFCKKGLRHLELIGNIYLVVATEQWHQRFQALLLASLILIILKKFLTWSCYFDMIIKLSVETITNKSSFTC